jgi:transposase-like protein
MMNPIFKDEAAAIAHMEDSRWGQGVSCPLCGTVGEAAKLGGQTKSGLWQCNSCRGKFTVRTGTVFERSHIPLHKWLLATHLMASSKKGISAHQLHRMLGITYKSAWFMAHRIREAMMPGQGAPMGSGGGKVEVDETFIGKKKDVPKRAAHHHKMKVLSLVDRTTGEARSVVLDKLNLAEVRPIMEKNISKDAHLMTDEARHYQVIGREYAKHDIMTHGMEEWARGEAHTNTIEGFFSVFKRGMIGTYQHCGEQHLHRYTAEFDFRYSNRVKLGINDAGRAHKILKGAEGKRLTYRQVS